MEAKDYLKRLNDISLRKLSLLQELLLFTQSQKDVIEAGRFDDLESLIKEKQLRMDAIDKLDEQFVVYSSRLKDLLEMNTFEDLPAHGVPGTAQLKELAVKIHEKLAEIKSIDDINSQLLKKELKQTQDQINHSNAFKRATGAYYPVKNEIPSCYFDKKK